MYPSKLYWVVWVNVHCTILVSIVLGGYISLLCRHPIHPNNNTKLFYIILYKIILTLLSKNICKCNCFEVSLQKKSRNFKSTFFFFLLLKIFDVYHQTGNYIFILVLYLLFRKISLLKYFEDTFLPWVKDRGFMNDIKSWFII